MTLDQLAIATCVLLSVHLDDAWYAEHYARAAAVLALLFPRVRGSVLLWTGITATLAAYCWNDWYWADNHKFLLTYWCLALTLAVGMADTSLALQRLRSASRWMLVLVMLAAGGWKLANSDFRSGAFFEFMLLTDARFTPKTERLAGLSAEALERNDERLQELRETLPGTTEKFPVAILESSPQVTRLAWWLTLLSVVSELWIGALYLLPAKQPLRRLREWSLVAFLAGTYLIAPVFGFGSVLAVLGAAESDCPRRQTVLLAMLAVLELYNVPHLVLM